jgi:hypothetical protein
MENYGKHKEKEDVNHQDTKKLETQRDALFPWCPWCLGVLVINMASQSMKISEICG